MALSDHVGARRLIEQALAWQLNEAPAYATKPLFVGLRLTVFFDFLDRPPALVRDPDASDFKRPAADYHDFPFCCCKPTPHQVEQFGRESCNESGTCAAVLACVCKHFKHKASSFSFRGTGQTQRSKSLAVLRRPFIRTIARRCAIVRHKAVVRTRRVACFCRSRQARMPMLAQ